ncbi:hypothetical protein FQA39_LY14007 [Lamprigera yunnana]|nr:hypothetical protein FQA39_LY14007 [Lamprigera yunnana]
MNNLAARDVILPEQPNDFRLYHSNCYRRFTALPPKYRKSKSEHVEASSSIPQKQEYDHNDSETNESSDVNIDVSENPQVAEVSNVAVEADTVDQDVTQSQNITICFFCEKSRKKIKGRENKLALFTPAGRLTIKNLAIRSQDSNMVNKLENLSSEQECFCHTACKNIYITWRESKLNKEKEKSDWHYTRDIRAEAYDLVEQFVSQNIVNQEQSYFLKFLNDMFINHLENNKHGVSNYTSKPYHLKERLLKKFPKKINLISFNGQTLVKPYKGIIK